MSYDGVIFDLDGTLWDSNKTCTEAWNTALALQKIPYRTITTDDIGSIMGLTHDFIFEKIFPDIPLVQREDLALECYRQEDLLIRKKGGSLYPYLEDGLKKLIEHYPLFIVSNCKQEYLDSFFEWSKLANYFQDSECAGNTGEEKGYNIDLLASRNGLENAVYIGDTRGDQEACRDAEVAFIYATYGFGKDVEQCTQVDSFYELVKLLLEKEYKGNLGS